MVTIHSNGMWCTEQPLQLITSNNIQASSISLTARYKNIVHHQVVIYSILVALYEALVEFIKCLKEGLERRCDDLNVKRLLICFGQLGLICKLNACKYPVIYVL